MTINPSGNHPYEGHAKINLDKLLNDPSIDLLHNPTFKAPNYKFRL